MDNKAHWQTNGFSEFNEPTIQDTGVEVTPTAIATEQMLLEYLLESGFAWDEATKLLDLREQLYDGVEMRQRMANDCRLHFARWLYEHGELREA